mgnify:CR=1 FL=1
MGTTTMGLTPHPTQNLKALGLWIIPTYMFLILLISFRCGILIHTWYPNNTTWAFTNSRIACTPYLYGFLPNQGSIECTCPIKSGTSENMKRKYNTQYNLLPWMNKCASSSPLYPKEHMQVVVHFLLVALQPLA